MSLEINVYTKSLSDELIPKIINRLNDYEMSVEVHPNFSFNDQTGFLPFKFHLTNPHLDLLKGKELQSGFELFVDDFDLLTEKEKRKPKSSLIAKLLNKKQIEIPYASTEIETRLKDCNKIVSFIWSSGDSFELRFAALTSAILTEITDGVCCYPADDIWYDNRNIVDDAYKEVKQYEETLKERDIKFHTFNNW